MAHLYHSCSCKYRCRLQDRPCSLRVPFKTADGLRRYPAADIPVIQLSLKSNLNAAEHLRMGAALAPLRSEGVLIVGSGAVTHSFAEMGAPGLTRSPPAWAHSFEQWLTSTLAVSDVDSRTAQLAAVMKTAPNARRAHPREEHLVCKQSYCMHACIVIGVTYYDACYSFQIPFLVAAGAAVKPDGTASPGVKVHDAWVLEAMSLASYRFD